MNDNRTLLLLVGLFFALAATAGLLVLVDGPLTFESDQLGEHRVTPDVVREGGADFEAEGPVVVTLEDDDIVGAVLTCGVYKRHEKTVDRTITFAEVPPEACSLAFEGQGAYEPVYAGDSLECFVVEQMTECLGGIARKFPGMVSVASEAGGDFFIGGDFYGPLPMSDLRVKPGTRYMRIELSPEIAFEYKLLVAPGEHVRLTFPAPDGYTAQPEAEDASGKEAEGG